LAALDRRVGVVVGTSGLSAADYDEIDAAAEQASAGVIAAGNFAIGAALLLRFATEAARHIAAWEVIDYASATKPHAPTATARDRAERLGQSAIGVPLEDVIGARDARGATVAGTQVHSLRLPSFVVSTQIVFAGQGERLTIRHDAGDIAEPYVAGTLLAIRA